MRPGSGRDCLMQGPALGGPREQRARSWARRRRLRRPGVLLGAFSFSRLQLHGEEPLWRAPSEPRAPWKLASQPPLPTCNLGPTSEASQPPPSLPAQLAAQPGLRSLGIPEPGRRKQRGVRRAPQILGLP